jgi:hypothetical protein
MKIFSIIRHQMTPLSALRYLLLARPNSKKPAMSRKIQFACFFFLLGLLSTPTQSGFAQNAAAPDPPPLSFGNNIFVTGDYVVAGAQGMASHLSNGFATGTITLPDTNPGITGTKQVPAGAQIVGALLYWQSVEKVGQPGSGQNGFFGPVINGVPQTYAITGAIPGGQNTVAFSSGGCSGSSTGKVLRTYRADVRGALPQDANGNVLANGTYQVRLPSVGNSTPLTLGATLVIIYRVLSPSVPLNSIVIYDGDFAPSTTSLVMTQTVQGFYDAAKNPVSRLTHIVGSGQSNKYQTVYLGPTPTTLTALPSLYGRGQPAFPGYYGNWDNPTWTFGDPKSNPVKEDNASATTQVVPTASNQGCVSWGAVIVSTTVKNDDGDGLLNVWKAPPISPNNPTGQPGYCDASINGGVCTVGNSSTGWVPLPGATRGKKDVFVQLDYMCSFVNPGGSCDTSGGNYSFNPFLTKDVDGKDAVQKVVDAFATNSSNPINLHVFPTYAIDERDPNVTCTDASPQQLCVFPNQPGVVGWPMGAVFLQNQLVDPSGNGSVCTTLPTPANCFPRFEHGKKDSWHYALFGHSLGLPNWTLGAGTLANVDPSKPGPNVVQAGQTVTFNTSIPLGTLNTITVGFDAQGNPIKIQDPNCPNGRVTVSFATTNPKLNGTYCVKNPTNPSDTTFQITVANSTNFTYTSSTDPNLAVASGQADAVSGFSDIGGEHSVITLGSWGPDGQTWQSKAGTFMHELGHSLGLTHGGLYFKKLANNSNDFTPTVEANCKPNDQSVMNYMFQVDLLGKLTGLDQAGNPVFASVVDYSGQNLTTLNEASATTAGVLSGTLYPTTTHYIPWTGVGTPATQHCDGTPRPANVQMSRVTDLTGLLSWSKNQDINFDGNTSESLSGHNDWVGTAMAPGVDLRQIGATGSLSAAGGLIGLGGGGGLTGLGGGGGLTGLGGGGGLIGLGGGGGLIGLGGGGGLTGLGGGGGLTGLGGGGGLTGLGGGGGLGELTRATANSVTRVPQNLTATEAASPRTITLNWFRPTFGQIGAYRIYRSSDGGHTFALVSNGANGAVPGNQLTFQDTVTCNPTGYQYYVTAVLAGTFATFPPAPTEGQESAPSNTVPATGQDPLTGCYATQAPSPFLTGFTSPAIGATFTQGDPVPIVWTVQDDHYTTGGVVSNTSAATLIAIGPLPHDGACPSLASVPVFLTNSTNYPLPFTILSGITFNNNQFTDILNTLTLSAGCFIIEGDFDSGQFERTEFQLLIYVAPTSLPDGVAGTAYNSMLTPRGGVAPFTWTLDSGTSLPPGISLDPSSGAFTGTPTLAGMYNFTVRVTDKNLNYGTRAFTLRVAIGITPTSLPDGVAGSAYSNALTPVGATGTVTWSIASGALPPGINLDANSGALTGIPTMAGSYNFTAQATDSAPTPNVGTRAFTLRVAIGITPTSLPDGVVGNAYSNALTAVGATGTVTWSIASGALPPGINLDANSGALTGTPTTAGIYNFTAQATDGAGNVGTRAFTLRVIGFGPTGSLSTARWEHTATLLNSGKVLITGGNGASSTLASAELYDSSTGSFGAAGSMNTPRSSHTATLLQDGRVLLAGGGTATAEIYDPTAGTFTTTAGTMTVARSGHTATLLPDGTVLIAGGSGDATAEIFSPANGGTFTLTTGTMTAARHYHTATLLSGQVLLAGGEDSSSANIPTLASAEIYDPTSQTFTSTGSLTTSRELHTATLLGGSVYAIGGRSGSSTGYAFLNSAESFTTPVFSVVSGTLNTARTTHTATLLQNGSVLISGGFGTVGGSVGALSSAELFNSTAQSFSPTISLATGRYFHTATLLNDGTVLVTGGLDSSSPTPLPLASAELYFAAPPAP